MDSFDLGKLAMDCLDDDLKPVCDNTDMSIHQLQAVLMIQNIRLLREIRKPNKHLTYMDF